MMLLRRTSVWSGAKALALAGLLGLGSEAGAQQPPVAAKAAPSGSIAIGSAVGNSVGMVTLPIRAAAETLATNKGTICGKLTLGNAVAADRFVYLVEGGKVVASTKTDADGAFDLTTPRAGDYTFMAGPFDANGTVRKMVRIDAAEGATQAVVLQQKGAAPGALVANPVNQESVLSPIGNKASGNADVVFVNGRFVANGQPVAAGNEYAVLEAGSFRGIVTQLDDNGVRAAMPGANLYLIRRGQVVSRTVSGANGGFTFTNIVAGGYTLLATVGGYGTAEVALNGVPGVEQGVFPIAAAAHGAVVAPVAAPLAPVASPYFAGLTAGVPGAVSVRFPFQAIAVQRIAVRDGAVAPAGVSGVDAEFRMEGADEVLVKVAFCQAGAGATPVLNLAPAPWEDLRLLIGAAQFEAPPVGLAATPAMDAGGGFAGGGGGGGGFGGAGALAGLAAAAALAAGSNGGGGGGGGGFSSPFRP